MLYHVALFAHITGALMYFVGVGLEVIVLRNLRRAQRAGQAQVWLQTGRGTIKLFPDPGLPAGQASSAPASPGSSWCDGSRH